MYFANHNRFHPFHAFRNLDQWMQELERTVTGSSVCAHSNGTTIPLNVRTNAQHAVVTAEVPGVDPQSISINVNDDVLTISYDNKKSADESSTAAHGISRTIKLPFSIDANATEAQCQHGLLTITLSASAKGLPKIITVKAA